MGQTLSACFGRTLIIHDVKTCSNPDCDPDLKPSSARELECLIDRLERIVDRLERTVSARELEETRRILKDACIVGKAVIRSNTSTNTEYQASARAVGFTANENTDQCDDLPTVLPSTPPPSASYLHQQVDSLESSLFPEFVASQPAKERHRDPITSKAPQYCHSPPRSTAP